MNLHVASYRICLMHCPKDVLIPLQFIFLKKKKIICHKLPKLCAFLEIPHLQNFQNYAHSH